MCIKAREVSDHYPVEVMIQTGRSINQASRPVSTGIEVISEIPTAANMLTALLHQSNTQLTTARFTILQLHVDNR